MSTERRVYPSGFPRQVSAVQIRKNEKFKHLIEQSTGSSQFTTAQFLAVAVEAVGEHVVLFLLEQNTELMLQVMAAVIEDHCRTNSRGFKDIQVNLISNCLSRLARAKNLPSASLYGEVERTLVCLNLLPDMKLAVRTALFDRQAILSLPMTIHVYH